MSRGTLVGLADIARLLQAEQEGSASGAAIETDDILHRAAQLGYELRPLQPDIDVPPELPRRQPPGGDTGALQGMPRPLIQHVPKTLFWVAANFQERLPAATEKIMPQLADGPVKWRGAPKESPPVSPLCSPDVLKPRLRKALAPLAETQEIDVPQAVRRVSSGKPLAPPPRRSRRNWPAQVLVLFDETPHLDPFLKDQNDLLALLADFAHGTMLRKDTVSPGELRYDMRSVTLHDT